MLWRPALSGAANRPHRAAKACHPTTPHVPSGEELVSLPTEGCAPIQRDVARLIDTLPVGRALHQRTQPGVVGPRVDQEIIDLVFVQNTLPVLPPARHGGILLPN